MLVRTLCPCRLQALNEDPSHEVLGDQMGLLLAAEQATSPLYLTVACESLALYCNSAGGGASGGSGVGSGGPGLGVALSAAGAAEGGDGDDGSVPSYQLKLTDYICRHLSGTVRSVFKQVLSAVEAEVGEETAEFVLSAIALSRGGLLELELRELEEQHAYVSAPPRPPYP